MSAPVLRRHHLIPLQFAEHPALEGIDIDASVNIIYLPGSRKLAAKMGVSPHPGGHLDSYYAVKRVLDEIAEISDRALRQAEVRNLQDAMRIALANEDLYTNNPDGEADAKSINRKLLADYNAYLGGQLDQRKGLQELEQRGRDTGRSHLIKLSPYLGNPERERQLSEAIADHPGVKVTAGNRDLEGTPWYSNFAPSDDVFRLPPSIPSNPTGVPYLPPFIPPSSRDLNEPEWFGRSDPRYAGMLPAFPAPGLNEQQLGQLPPSTAAQPDPLVLKFDPATGAPLPFYENPLMRDASAGSSTLAQDVLPWMAALGMAAPFVPAWLSAILAGVALTRAANARESNSNIVRDVVTDGGGVFSTGAPAYNAFTKGGIAADTATSDSLSSQSQRAPLGQEAMSAGSFADRFGNWTETPAGTVPAYDPPAAPPTSAAQAVAPDEVRRLARVNTSNAGSVFTSGSAPIPYLPSTEFDDWFGNWTMSTVDGRSSQTSRPIRTFASEPSYLISPPIFGVDDSGKPRNDAEEWFSRWIGPVL